MPIANIRERVNHARLGRLSEVATLLQDLSDASDANAEAITASNGVTVAIATAGIDRTGTTSSSTAANALMVAMHAAGGGTLFWPRGTYKLDAPLIVPYSVTFVGDGGGTALYPSSSFPAQLTYGGKTFEAPLILCESTASSTYRIARIGGFRLDGRLNGTGSTTFDYTTDCTAGLPNSGLIKAGGGMVIIAGANRHVHDIDMVHFRKYDLVVTGVQNSLFENLRLGAVWGDGGTNLIYEGGARSNNFVCVNSRQPGKDGYNIHIVDGDTYSVPETIQADTFRMSFGIHEDGTAHSTPQSKANVVFIESGNATDCVFAFNNLYGASACTGPIIECFGNRPGFICNTIQASNFGGIRYNSSIAPTIVGNRIDDVGLFAISGAADSMAMNFGGFASTNDASAPYLGSTTNRTPQYIDQDQVFLGSSNNTVGFKNVTYFEDKATTTYVDASATVAVAGLSHVAITNTGAQNITNLTGGVTGQSMKLILTAGNTNTTVVHGTNFLLAGAASVVSSATVTKIIYLTKTAAGPWVGGLLS